MPLPGVSQLAQTIEAALNRQSDVEVDPAFARKQMAQDLAVAFDAYVRSGLVTVTVVTTGTATTQSGGGTGNIT